MTLTHLDLDRIEGLAKAAEQSAPGPWTLYHDTCATCEKNGTAEFNITPLSGGYHAMFGERVEAEYIAALDPTTVLALIAYTRELEEALEPFVKMAEGEPDTIMLRTDGPWFRRARTALQRKTS